MLRELLLTQKCKQLEIIQNIIISEIDDVDWKYCNEVNEYFDLFIFSFNVQ